MKKLVIPGICAALMSSTVFVGSAFAEQNISKQYNIKPITLKAGVSTNQIVDLAKKQVGKPYVFGAVGPNAFDCSGFVYYVLKNSGVNISRTSVAGYWNSSVIEKVSNPRPGDLIFFQNTYKAGPSHIGIMINDTEFIHAADEKTGVTISNKNSSYNKQHFLGYGRVVGASKPEEHDPTDVDTRKNVTLPSDWQTNNLGYLRSVERQSWVYNQPNENAEVIGKIPLDSRHAYFEVAWDGKRFWFKIANDNWIPETAARIEKDGKSTGVIWNERDGLECYHHANYNSGIRDRVGVGQLEIEYRDGNWIYIKDKGWVEFDEKIIRWLR